MSWWLRARACRATNDGARRSRQLNSSPPLTTTPKPPSHRPFFPIALCARSYRQTRRVAALCAASWRRLVHLSAAFFGCVWEGWGNHSARGPDCLANEKEKYRKERRGQRARIHRERGQASERERERKTPPGAYLCAFFVLCFGAPLQRGGVVWESLGGEPSPPHTPPGRPRMAHTKNHLSPSHS